jgi:hypothetical protein
MTIPQPDCLSGGSAPGCVVFHSPLAYIGLSSRGKKQRSVSEARPFHGTAAQPDLMAGYRAFQKVQAPIGSHSNMLLAPAHLRTPFTRQVQAPLKSAPHTHPPRHHCLSAVPGELQQPHLVVVDRASCPGIAQAPAGSHPHRPHFSHTPISHHRSSVWWYLSCCSSRICSVCVCVCVCACVPMCGSYASGICSSVQ